jgi:hypothetical protein
MRRKVMKLLDPNTGKMECRNTGKMECRVCGSIHWANLIAGRRYFRGSWKCINGCRLREPNQR